MSDDQILDLFQNANQWLPINGVAATVPGANILPGPAPVPAGSVSGTSVASAANTALPPLQFGSDVEIAGCVSQVLRQERGEVIFSEGHFWYYVGSHWRVIEPDELRRTVHRYDGSSPTRGSFIKLGKSRIDSILNELSAMLMRKDFFAEALIGMRTRDPCRLPVGRPWINHFNARMNPSKHWVGTEEPLA
jgi:hypothetical protein